MNWKSMSAVVRLVWSGGHQTGGAVDLTLCDINGIPLDMGSEYPVKCPEMVTSYVLAPIVNERRRLLCNVMRKEGFVNYPGNGGILLMVTNFGLHIVINVMLFMGH